MLGKFPDFIIIGAQKAGTSSLQHYLKKAKGVFLPAQESTHYFDTDYFRKPEWYADRFIGHNHRITGECTRFYCMHPLIPKRIRHLLPSVKIIFLLRNPIDRAYSHYQDKIRLKIEYFPTFEQAINAENKRIKGSYKRLLEGKPYPHGAPYREFTYLTKGKYIEQAQRWFAEFPKEQIMLIQSEELFTNTDKVFKEVLKFIGAEEQSLGMYMKCNKYKHTQPIDPKTRDKLREYFEPFNQKLYKFIGREFDWK